MLSNAGAVRRRVILSLALMAGVVIVLGAADVFAQTAPFGGPRPPAAPPPDGIAGWILARQAEFYRGLSGLIRQAKADGSALWGLFGLSFLYGIFHAAGPGHGKAVISSYMVANEETWTRGVVLSFASSMLQAIVAVAVVGVAAWLLGATAAAMNEAVRWIEIASYALIALIGARLIWVKGRGFLAALRGSDATHAHHDHDHHDHAHEQHAHHDHAHDHAHDHHHDDHKHHDHGHDDHGHDHHGHSHGPEPQELAGPGGWQRGLSAIVAVGLRPCSGAILVLVFALAQGLFWAGVASAFIMGLGTFITVAAIATLAVGAKSLAARIASSRGGSGAIAIRGVELLAAIVVCAFGLALLAGYVANERLGF